MTEAADDNLMYRLLVESVQDYAIYMLDRDGNILNWNAGAVRAKGYTADEIIGQNYARFYSGDDQAAGVPRANLDRAYRDSRLSTEGWRYRKDGTAFWASVVIDVIRDAEEAFIGFAKVTRDLTERREAELRAEYQARHDGLTGVLNRRGFTETLDERLKGPSTENTCGILYVDLDHFKPINDTFGHAVGDQVLRETARRLAAITGDRGVLGRLGGDEFAVLLHGADETLIGHYAQRVVGELCAPIQMGGNTLNVGASVGAATAPAHGSNVLTLLRNADLAMYRAKFDGRRCWRSYDEAMGDAALARSNLEYRLREATAAEDFHLLYQPIVDGQSGRTLGYEALIRWLDEAGASVGPAAFIPVAESIGVMPALGEWTLRTACAAAASWPDDLYVSVNLSATQFHHPPLANLVIQTLIETGLPARRLMLEITETSVLEDLPGAKRALARLRDIGIRIALDDFGTGYSSLSLVKELPLTCIKIDRGFISGKPADEVQASAFVKSIMALCEGSDLQAIAEGVETEAQRALLLGAGCSVMQGYLFGRPDVAPGQAVHQAVGLHNHSEPSRRARTG